MKMSPSIKELAAALSKAQGAMLNAKKDSENPFFKSKYADLASVVDAVKKPLADNGLSYAQFPCSTDKDEVGVETLLMHSSGEWLQGDPFFIPVSKGDAQGFGSALTYCRRYDLAAVCGVAPEDDDGNAAAAARPARPNTATQVAVDAFEMLDTDTKDMLQRHAVAIIALSEDKGDVVAYLDRENFDTESKLALWSLLPSQVRSYIKRQQAAKAPAPILTPADYASQA